jgi:hypothetical protein
MRFEDPSRHKPKRVCPELHSVVRNGDAVQKMEGALEAHNHVEVERTELVSELIGRSGVNFRRQLS